MSFAASDPPMDMPQSAAQDFRPGFGFGIVVMFASFCLWAIAGFQIIVVAPRFVRGFNEFRMAIPLTTQLVLDYAIWIAPVAMAFTFLLCALFRSRWMWILLLLAVPVFVNLSIIANLYYPELKLLEALGK